MCSYAEIHQELYGDKNDKEIITDINVALKKLDEANLRIVELTHELTEAKADRVYTKKILEKMRDFVESQLWDLSRFCEEPLTHDGDDKPQIKGADILKHWSQAREIVKRSKEQVERSRQEHGNDLVGPSEPRF